LMSCITVLPQHMKAGDEQQRRCGAVEGR
jgi:hypothetical protein